MKDIQRARRKRKLQKGVEKAEKNRANGLTKLRDDGRRYNGYQCDPKGGCGGIYLTVDLDRGATPMFMPCFITEGCDGMAVSLGYPKSPPPLKVPLLIEWYQPDSQSLAEMPAALAEHIRRGGMARRPTEDAPQWVKDRIGPAYLREGERWMQPVLTYIEGDTNGDSQEQGDHVHHGGSEAGSGATADSRDSGTGQAVGEGEEGPAEPGQEG